MTKEEIRKIVDIFDDTYLTREEIKEELYNITFEDVIDYIYDTSHALAEIKNGLRGEHE